MSSGKKYWFVRAAGTGVAIAPSADRKEIGTLLRGCERILGRLDRVAEEDRVATALQKLSET